MGRRDDGEKDWVFRSSLTSMHAIAVRQATSDLYSTYRIYFNKFKQALNHISSFCFIVAYIISNVKTPNYPT